MPAFTPARSCRAARSDLPPQRRRPCARIARRASRRARSRADRHRRRVLHGRRSGAPRRARWRSRNEHDAWLMTDDAHGLGVVGGGRGSSFSGNTHVPVPLQMGTLSKAIGAYGGYLCASDAGDRTDAQPRAHADLFDRPAARDRRRRIAALDVIEREPDYAALPVEKARAFTHSPACPTRKARSCRWSSARKTTRSPPRGCWRTKASSPPPSARRRCRQAPRGCGLTFTAQHPDEAIERLAGIVRDAHHWRTEPWPPISSPRPAPISARPSSPPA